jgi:hypothetical protein
MFEYLPVAVSFEIDDECENEVAAIRGCVDRHCLSGLHCEGESVCVLRGRERDNTIG